MIGLADGLDKRGEWDIFGLHIWVNGGTDTQQEKNWRKGRLGGGGSGGQFWTYFWNAQETSKWRDAQQVVGELREMFEF